MFFKLRIFCLDQLGGGRAAFCLCLVNSERHPIVDVTPQPVIHSAEEGTPAAVGDAAHGLPSAQAKGPFFHIPKRKQQEEPTASPYAQGPRALGTGSACTDEGVRGEPGNDILVSPWWVGGVGGCVSGSCPDAQ